MGLGFVAILLDFCTCNFGLCSLVFLSVYFIRLLGLGGLF